MTGSDTGSVDDTGTTICQICREEFPSQEDLLAHLRTVHPEERLADEGA
jgi:hypothetical protein